MPEEGPDPAARVYLWLSLLLAGFTAWYLIDARWGDALRFHRQRAVAWGKARLAELRAPRRVVTEAMRVLIEEESGGA